MSQKDETFYQIDQDGYLIDENGYYILDEEGNLIILAEEEFVDSKNQNLSNQYNGSEYENIKDYCY